MNSRLWVWGASLLFIGVILWPGSWAKGRDSFPLSSYPMFARKRTSPMLTMEYAVAYRDSKERFFVSPPILGSSEVLQAKAIVANALRQAPAKRKQFCETVLQRLQANSDTANVTRVELLKGTHDSVAYLRGNHDASTEKVVARCGK